MGQREDQKEVVYDAYEGIITELQYINPDSVQKICQSIIQKANLKGDSLSIYRAEMSIGRSYYVQGDYDMSLYHYGKAARYFDVNPQMPYLAHAHNGVGLAYAAVEDHQKAYPEYQIAIDLFRQEGDSAALANPYFNNGISYKDQAYYQNQSELYKTALAWFQLAEEKAKQYENRVILLRVYALRGELFFFQKNFKDAEKEYRKSLELITPNEDWDKGFVLGGLAATDIELKNYDDAIQMAQEAIEIQQKLDAKWEESRVLEYLYKAYEAKGDVEKTIETMKRYTTLLEEVFGERRIEDVNSLKKAMDELEKTRFKLEQQQIKQKVFIQQLILVMLFVIVFAGTIYVVREKKKQVLIQQLNEDLEKKNKELNFLITRKNEIMSVLGHDMTNLMGSLDGFSDLARTHQISKEEFDEVAPFLYQNVVRMQLTFANLHRWAQFSFEEADIQGESECLKVFEETRFIFEPMQNEHAFQIDIDCEPEIKIPIPEDYLKVILRNLVHNAGKFTPNNGSIKMYAVQMGGKTRIGVKDSGIGMSVSQIGQILKTGNRLSTNGVHGEGGTGLGLIAVKGILKLYHSELRIESSAGNGTDFYFFIAG